MRERIEAACYSVLRFHNTFCSISQQRRSTCCRLESLVVVGGGKADRLAKPAMPGPVSSKARVYADANTVKSKEYWDYEAHVPSWRYRDVSMNAILKKCCGNCMFVYHSTYSTWYSKYSQGCHLNVFSGPPLPHVKKNKVVL